MKVELLPRAYYSECESEVSQKEDSKYCILTHIYEIKKYGTDEPICRAAMERWMWRADLWTPGWGAG